MGPRDLGSLHRFEYHILVNAMGLDIRWPIGILFTIYGTALIVYGLLADPAIFENSLGVNIDVWWGAAMLGFGLCMAGLAWRASRRSQA
jgi:hypothetical protein